MLPPIISPEEFAAALPKVAGRLNPEQLGALLERASDKVRRYCGWHIAPVLSRDLVLDGSGGFTLLLPTLRLVDVTAFSVMGVPLIPALLEWSEDGFVRLPTGFPDRLRSVRATIEDGYEDAGDVVQVLLDVIERAANTPAGITQESTGANALSYIGGGALVLLPSETAVLDLYRVRT